MKKITIFLIKRRPFRREFPGWPEVVSIYSKYLPKGGYNIWWISPSPEVHTPEKKMWNHINLHLIPLKDSSSVMKMITHITIPWQVFNFLKKEISTENNTHIIIQVRDSFYGAIIALLFKKKYGIPIVFNYSFPFYEESKELLSRTHFSFLKFLYHLIFYKLLLYPILYRFDIILPISREMMVRLAREAGIPENKQIPLPLAVDVEEIYPTISDKIRRELKSKMGFKHNDFILIYPGSITKDREIRKVIRALIPVMEKYNNIHLILIGDGDDLEEITKEINEAKIAPRVKLIKRWLSRKELQKYYSISDLGISLIPPKTHFIVASPCKLFEYLGNKIVPISNPEIIEQKRIISCSKGGVLLEWDSIPAKLSETVEYIMTNPKIRKKMAFTGHLHVIKNRTFEKHSKILDRTYKALLKRRDEK